MAQSTTVAPSRPRSGRARVLVAVALSVLLSAAAIACSGDDEGDGPGPTAAPAEAGPIGAGERCGDGDTDGLLIGSLLPETGDFAFLHDSLDDAIHLAVCEVDRAGGANGAPVGVVSADSGSNEEMARTGADSLVAQSVGAVVGPASGREAVAVAGVLAEAGVVGCSPSATEPSVDDADDRGLFFRTAPSDALQAGLLADQVVDDGRERVAVLTVGEDMRSMGAAVEAGLTAQEVEANHVEIVEGDPDEIGNAVQAVADQDPDAVVLMGTAETAGLVLAELVGHDLGPAAVATYLSNGLQSDDLYGIVDPSDPAVVAGAQGFTPAPAPTATAEVFTVAFAEYAPGIESIFSAHAYDCVVTLALAATQAESTDGGDIATNMASVTTGGTRCTAYAECVELIADGEDIDYDGASGALELSEDGSPRVGVFDHFTFGEDGTFEMGEQVVAPRD
jgi:branched-chain amino acid transport system substrate-binding protein